MIKYGAVADPLPGHDSAVACAMKSAFPSIWIAACGVYADVALAFGLNSMSDAKFGVCSVLITSIANPINTSSVIFRFACALIVSTLSALSPIVTQQFSNQ